MQKGLIYLIIAILLWSCKQKNGSSEYPAIDVVGYMKGQLKILDSIPYGILKITEIKDRKADSLYIKKDALYKLLSPFLSSEISQSLLETEYEEKVFADASTKKVNITYDAKNEDAKIHQVVVYMDPLKEEISLLYITGFFENSGGVIKKQLLWNHNKGFQIISVDSRAASDNRSYTEKIIWQ